MERVEVKPSEMSELWDRIEDWFDGYQDWNHCYTIYDPDGRLIHIQSSGRSWCQGAHYLQSGHYDWNGKTRLEWSLDEESGKGTLRFPNGRKASRWAGYLAVILFKTDLRYDFKRKHYRHLWDGSPPRLLFRRERASKKRFESGRRFFSHSPFLIENDSERIKLPQAFLGLARIYFDHLNEYITELTRSQISPVKRKERTPRD